jgi:hypothetical protein
MIGSQKVWLAAHWRIFVPSGADFQGLGTTMIVE